MLKKRILLFIPLLFFALTSRAQQTNPQLVFDRANEKLQQGDIGEAIAMYANLQEQGQVSGALFLNMALSYVEIDSMGMAKYYFLKAKQFDETQDRALEGLKYVETRFSHQSAVLPVLPWERALDRLSNNVGPLVLLALGLLLINIGVLLYIGFWFIKEASAVWPRTAIAAASLGFLIILLGFYTNYRSQRYSKAVMVTQEARVMKQPQNEAALVNRAFEGYEFTVDHTKSNKQANWSYIRLSNGQYGWIPTKEIMIL